MDDGLRINDLTQVFIGAGVKLSDPPSANSAPPRFNHHWLRKAETVASIFLEEDRRYLIHT